MTKTTRGARRRCALVFGTGVVVGSILLAGCTSTGTPAPTASSVTSAASGAPASVIPSAARPTAPAGELPAELQSRLQSAVDRIMADNAVPGAAVGVWIPGEGSWTSASGVADIATNQPVSTDMQWPLRSVTKSYTVTLLLQLVDEGLVSLDDTLATYVDGVTDGDTITLRQLADMSSGNADYTNDDFASAFVANPDRIFTLDDLNGFVLGRPAQFAPGAKRVYTNADTNLLGAVIEKVTGQPFATVLRQRILDPLQQAGTDYLTDIADWTAPHATGYQVEDGVTEAQTENPSIFAAAGSMFTTLDDARVWADTLGSGALLSPETQKEREVGAPLDSGPPYDSYALGIGETSGWWGHNGEGIGFTAAVFHNDSTGASIAVFMNESGVPDVHPADATFRALATVLAEGA
ncbi:hypothetical protein B7R54_06200 [Subtercola boreus]|uniref:Beta-lactamase-related domain-containing protein n=1 Tax=Subtercola boreus TaxID=120213 RepID=A0A3E0VGK8_9MICO|nr:serine hydrolase domain-containing protein [Subtercola boreus]RFA08861.1 hypothetical protein B7R54_06200 [Subtercola boreus]TQL54164.1 D-alanyl-D-alanine carboxypeptidase [Subtercola boreus]